MANTSELQPAACGVESIGNAYRLIRLPNGLEALLVDDPEGDKAGCAVYTDPEVPYQVGSSELTPALHDSSKCLYFLQDDLLDMLEAQVAQGFEECLDMIRECKSSEMTSGALQLEHPNLPTGDLVITFIPQRVQLPNRLAKLVRTPLLTTTLASFLPLATCTQISHRTPKILAISLSALSSLSTGMTSLQLELLANGDADNPPHSTPRETRLTRMWLRIACSVSLGLLAVGYTLWFLRSRGWYKKKAFLVGFSGCSLFCWVFVSPGLSASSSSSGGKGGGDGFGWLDAVNLFGLIAVVVGILNAESSLFGGLFTSSGDDQGDEGRRATDDEERQNLSSVRTDGEGDGQNPVGGRRRGDRDAEHTSSTALGILTLASHVLGA